MARTAALATASLAVTVANIQSNLASSAAEFAQLTVNQIMASGNNLQAVQTAQANSATALQAVNDAQDAYNRDPIYVYGLVLQNAIRDARTAAAAAQSAVQAYSIVQQATQAVQAASQLAQVTRDVASRAAQALAALG